MIDPLIHWLIDWSIDWLIDRSIDWLIHWSIHWLIDWLIDPLIHWLIDWLIDWLIAFIPLHPRLGVIFFSYRRLIPNGTRSFSFVWILRSTKVKIASAGKNGRLRWNWFCSGDGSVRWESADAWRLPGLCRDRHREHQDGRHGPDDRAEAPHTPAAFRAIARERRPHRGVILRQGETFFTRDILRKLRLINRIVTYHVIFDFYVQAEGWNGPVEEPTSEDDYDVINNTEAADAVSMTSTSSARPTGAVVGARSERPAPLPPVGRSGRTLTAACTMSTMKCGRLSGRDRRKSTSSFMKSIDWLIG